jgi:hypothetical protein
VVATHRRVCRHVLLLELPPGRAELEAHLQQRRG